LTLPTAALVRTHGIPSLGTGTGEDANITVMIARADAVLAAWCGFPAASVGAQPTLEAATYTEYHDGPSALDARAIRLCVRPVTSVTSVHDDTDRDWVYGADDLVDSGDYTVAGEDGVVWLHNSSTHGSWGVGPRILKVIYVAGYDSGSHAAITQGITALVAHWWYQKHTAGIETETLGDSTTTPLDNKIPEHVRQIMWGVRMIEVGLGG